MCVSGEHFLIISYPKLGVFLIKAFFKVIFGVIFPLIFFGMTSLSDSFLISNRFLRLFFFVIYPDGILSFIEDFAIKFIWTGLEYFGEGEGEHLTFPVCL